MSWPMGFMDQMDGVSDLRYGWGGSLLKVRSYREGYFQGGVKQYTGTIFAACPT